MLVDNDVNLAAVGEKWRGLAAGVSTFVVISIGAGVGMGIVIDDELFRGFHGAAGEIGYLPLTRDPFGEQHRRLGGLEDEIGAAGIVDAYREAGGRGRRRRATCSSAPASASRGAAVIELAAKRIGLAIATVSAVIDPELVMLGGRIGGAPELLPGVRAAVGQLLPLPMRIEAARSPSAHRSRARSRWGCARRASGCSRRSGARPSSGQAPRKRRVDGAQAAAEITARTAAVSSPRTPPPPPRLSSSRSAISSSARRNASTSRLATSRRAGRRRTTASAGPS